MATRREPGGWYGLVGYTDPVSREGFYRWCPEMNLRDAVLPELDPPKASPTPPTGTPSR
jgi:hypothetical protein